ncbi:hypothetical protein A3D85_00600 [Candidatus Amesbacteria bacterium RIFCSPHIGHO2_02_FULL_47_9]|nr:MAG: hypothetical protein A3D85_00600 [Candidatus Amesbacteria bacterium RIFCSPHIGHO2_02_FULL_47_9]
MLGFLAKIIIVAAVVSVIGYVVFIRRGSLPDFSLFAPDHLLSNAISSVKKVDPKVLSQNVSDSLDKLITHPDKNSPVVLGVKITNESLNKLVDVIQTLPPDQVSQIKQAICATASGN